MLEAARARGLSLVDAEAFRAPSVTRQGVRLSLGAPSKAATLARALREVAALLKAGPA